MIPWPGVALATLLGMVAATAAAVRPGEAAPASVEPPAIRANGGHPVIQAFDPLRSRAVFKVGMRLPLRVEGRFDRADGELRQLAGQRFQVLARLDARGLRMQGPEWIRRLTLSADFLDVERHPGIRFESIEADAALLRAGGPLRGRLLLRGSEREVAFELLPAACERPGRDCDIQVRGRLDRHDFGMHAHRFSVRDEVGFGFHIRLAEPLS